MKKFLAILLALVMTLALVACGQQNDADNSDSTDNEQPTETEFQSNILFCGSTSLYPIISSLASSFTEKYVKWNAVDPSFPETNISIYVAPGGSGVGVSAAIDGTADFGMIARDIKDSEVEALGENYSQYIVARDALTVSVNASNPICSVMDDMSTDTIRQLMIGRELSGHYYREDKGEKLSDEVVLEMQSVTAGDLHDVTMQLHRGEILGIGGLSDCGIHTLGKALYGLLPPVRGEVRKNGTQRVKSPSWAVRNGMAYVSKNRDTESMMLVCSVKDNICLPSLHDLAAFGPISPKKQKKHAAQWAKKMEVKANSVETFCNTLSGGNKQKVVLAKWLGKDAEILILDCPTRGIDVGTKAAIYQLIEELKAEGRSIVLISEELPELIGMSDRILLLKDGRISGEFFRKDGLTEAKLIEKMI